MSQGKNKAASRREFLKTAGKFAVYTPPALMIMSNANAKDMYKSCNTDVYQKKSGRKYSGNGWLQKLLNNL